MAKKTFKDNPALQFISEPEAHEDEEPTPAEAQPAAEPQREQAETAGGFKIQIKKAEPRSRRVQLLMEPSLFRKIEATAGAYHLSINELIHQIIEQAMKED